MTISSKARLGLGMTAALALSACANSLPYDPDFRGVWGGPFSTAQGAGAGGAVAPAGSGQVSDGFSGQGVDSRVPTDSVSPPAPAAGTPAQTHTVAAGETAYSIARKYGVTLQDLARANGLSESMIVRTGQRLNIPGTTGVAGDGLTAPGAGSPTPVPPSATGPLPSEKVAAASTPVNTPANDLGSQRTASSGGKFLMPVQGGIARPYQKGVNDGIDISASAGSTVSAASGGTVAVVTKDTNGQSIIVVQHGDGLMTVYANVASVSVAKGATVSKGQTIAKAGSGPVHFEVRRNLDSIDPMTYL